jgi:uncharacterized membrane protein YccC
MRNSLGIGDTDIFDWDGVLSTLIGTIIVLVIATLVFRRTSSRPSLYPLWDCPALTDRADNSVRLHS